MAEPGYTRYTPLYDWAFKRIFGSEDSRAVTMPFVNAVLRHVGLPEIERIDEIGSDVAIPNVVGLKAPSVDVLLVSDGRVIDLEAQTMRVDVESKMTYYAASLLARRVRRGEDPYYRNLPQVVVISLVQGWTVFAGPQAVTLGRMCWEREGGPVPGRDKVALVVCELDKVAARYNGASEAMAGDELAYARRMPPSAGQLIHAVELRQTTLERLAGIILREQRAFFLGQYSLLPLRVDEAAAEIGVHEATVYRAIQGKYLYCARGAYPLSHFFQREASGGTSVARVKEIIRELCQGQARLSDRAIAEALEERGIRLSRRTVAKYRSQMDIHSSFRRGE